ncbi:hypothetical protein, partial [Klebsiella aerogenes]|uniref:hypothetical protein n=1 Tax=Klebsiella aerogenes TaxID=548 RepID=UPI001952E1CC
MSLDQHPERNARSGVAHYPGRSRFVRRGMEGVARAGLLGLAVGPILAGSMLVLPTFALPILAAPALAAESALPLEPGLYLPAG